MLAGLAGPGLVPRIWHIFMASAVSRHTCGAHTYVEARHKNKSLNS